MDSRWSRVALALAILILCPSRGFAHKLYVFARVEGATIQGRAYFPGDVPAQQTDIIARDPTRRELGRTTTDDDGKFTLTPREHVDYCLLAEAPDGHTGQYIVHASELPDSLPAASADAAASKTESAKDHVFAAPAAAESNVRPPTATRDQLIELSKQIGALRQEMYDSEQRIRFRDLLGGIGFILGIAGVAFYMKVRKNRRWDKRM
jgi:nickel transport protein